VVTPGGGHPGHGSYIDGEVIDEQVAGRVHDVRVVRYGTVVQPAAVVRYYGASDITR
jgi:hypothetical protein